MTPLPSPHALKQRYPAPTSFIQETRERATQILNRSDPRLALIIGPCSIHDPKATKDYAQLLKELTPAIEHQFFPIFRLFIEKPRSLFGWKGMLYDPFLNGSNDLASGLELSRKLWVELAEMEIPCATELLDPLAISYFDDLIVWGMVGARTSASQPHRQLASGLSFPVGFKNDCYGEIDAAISGIQASRAAHSHLGIDQNGKIVAVQTRGNPLTHLVLRGGKEKTNFDQVAVKWALDTLNLEHLEPRIVIDCSHGNSAKDPERQAIAFDAVIEQVEEGNQAIAGIMLESYLETGKQEIKSPLRYGVSVTDACLGWEATESLLLGHSRV